MPRAKRVPVRTCVGCRAQQEKRALIRVARRPDGHIVVDRDGRAPGRGAYVCRSLACVERARKAKSLRHALKCEVPEEVWTALREAIGFASPTQTA